MGSFEIKDDAFHLDGEPSRVLAGAMHYFRVHPAYWEDRMRKMQLMGLNTLETYVAWNMHEPRPAEFDFDGWMDLVKYIEIAADLGLKVIVRPGPYICSEWELGGLPSWLLKDPGMRLRCSYGPYLDAVDRYFSELLPRLAPLQISRGGPIIAMQIENEYGSYGNDHAYLQHLEDQMRANGISTLLFTSDGATDEMLQYGTLPHIFKTANFGSHAGDQFAKLREYQPDGPLMCMEFWNGWFDHWGETHHAREPEDAAAALDELLATGASVTFYMFHGGTNFGFMNGANYAETYQPTVTSYDDDAPLTENGDITPKFEAFRAVIGKYHTVPDERLPQPTPTMSVEPFELGESVGLLSSLGELSCPVASPVPAPMEFLDQAYGLIVYETRVSGPRDAAALHVREVHDRGHVFVDGALGGIIERERAEADLQLTVPAEGIVLKIVVENMGRINYGNRLADRKGVTDCVMLGQQILHGWTIYPLPLDDLSQLKFSSADAATFPAFFRGNVQIDLPQDSFLSTKGWGKGIAWLNGFNLGRYWARGPQQTLYAPKPLFHEGRNEVLLLELDGPSGGGVEFVASPVLDGSGPG